MAGPRVIHPRSTAAGVGGRRWLMLALGVAAQTAACAFVYGVPYLVPVLRSTEHLSLAQAGTVVACPTIGLVLALVAWGAAADRYGERAVLAVGLFLSTAFLSAAMFVRGMAALAVLFTFAGIAGASVFAASGRVVIGWFGASQRGLAMGVRQTSTPLGMAIAALAIPPLATHGGLRGALLFIAGFTLVVAVLVALYVKDPPRKPASPTAAQSRSPYRGPLLWRIHGASALLVWPQFTVSAFGLVFLVDVRHWDATSAGRLLAAGQVLGALGRIAAGRWSDHIGSRLRPMRRLAASNAILMLLLAACAIWPSPASDVLLIAACALTASTNGLAYTSTAELAGPQWAGRALGVQNTGQNISASLTPPLVGILIGATSYGTAFAIAAAFATTAILVTPPDH